jgi:hypothetical protein
MGVDPAGGAGGDNAVIEILDVQTGEQVAEFVSDRTKADMLAIEAVEYAIKFGNCLIVPEINNHGLAFVVKCKELGYTNIYTRLVYDKEVEGKERTELGFLTSRATKPLILYGLSFALGELSILVHSELLLKELRSYPKSELDDIPTHKTVIDPVTKHFDRTMALALAWEGRKTFLGSVKTTKYN